MPRNPGKYLTKQERRLLVENIQAIAEQHGTLTSPQLRHLAGNIGVSERTMRRWLQETPAARRREPEFQLSDVHYVAIAAEPNLKAAWARLRAGGTRMPSYPHFTKLVNAVDPMILAGARTGRRAMAEAGLYVVQQPRLRNEEWQIDHVTLPIRVQPSKGKPVQPVLTVVIDYASRLVVATALWTGQPKAEQTLAAVAKAVYGQHLDDTFVGGVPGALRSDRGADLIGDEMTIGLLRLGIVADPTQARAPHEKGVVEAWIQRLQEECIAFLPGYTGGPTNHAGQSVLVLTPGELLTLEDLVARVGQWVELYNTQRVHGTLGVTPMQAWRADTTPIRVANEQAVASCGLTVTRARRKQGIRIHNRDYISAAMASAAGELTVSYLPDAHEQVWVHIDGRWSRSVQHADLSEEEHEQIQGDRQAKSARVTKIHRGARELRAADEVATNLQQALPSIVRHPPAVTLEDDPVKALLNLQLGDALGDAS